MSKAQPTEVLIPVPWGHIAGCWWGDRHRRPILAVHGYQDNAGTFARLAPLIAPHTPVLAIDLQGHGRSSHYPHGFNYYSSDFVRVIHLIVLYHNWSQVSLMGHSFGAGLCFHYASLFPDSIDLIIALDSVVSLYYEPNLQLVLQIFNLETEELQHEPLKQSLYTREELAQKLYEGSERSLELKHCNYLVERNVKPAPLEANKFYLSRDKRVKFLHIISTEPRKLLAMAARICNVHYLVLKAEHSDHVNEPLAKGAIELLRANNPHFQMHTLKGEKHHMHMNSAEKVAREYVLPFLEEYRKEQDVKAKM